LYYVLLLETLEAQKTTKIVLIFQPVHRYILEVIYEGKSENTVPYFIDSHSEMPLYSLITHFTSIFFHTVTFSVDVKESEVSNKRIKWHLTVCGNKIGNLIF
jgi:hypothetical protein